MAGDTWAVLIYDGDCGFCLRCADWLRARGDVPMVSDGEVDRLVLGLTPEETKTAVWWVEGRTRFSGHHAIGHALRPLGGGWALVGRLICVPPLSWLAAVTYQWVAANRHRFG